MYSAQNPDHQFVSVDNDECTCVGVWVCTRMCSVLSDSVTPWMAA